jgi:hypothetical protein
MRILRSFLTGLVVILFSGIAAPALSAFAYVPSGSSFGHSAAATATPLSDTPIPSPSTTPNALPTPDPSANPAPEQTTSTDSLDDSALPTPNFMPTGTPEPAVSPTPLAVNTPPHVFDTTATIQRTSAVRSVGKISAPGQLAYEVFNGYQDNYWGAPWSQSSELIYCTAGETTDVYPLAQNWYYGGAYGCNSDQFVVHWMGYIHYPQSQTLCFANATDDGIHMTIDGQSIFDSYHWTEKPAFVIGGGCFAFTANVNYTFDAWYYDNFADSSVNLLWSDANGTGTENGSVDSSFFSTDWPQPLHMVSWPSMNATVGQYYASYIQGGGSSAPTYSVVNGTSLPPGLSLNGITGKISGTPTTAGTYTVDYGLTSAYANYGWYVHTGQMTFTVADGSSTNSAPIWQDSTVATSCTVGTSYSDGVSAVGSPTPTYSLVGSLPPGLALDTTTGALTGTCTDIGTYQFAIKASNLVDDAVTEWFTFDSFQSPSWQDSTVELHCTVGTAYSDFIAASGNPSPTYSVTGTLPPGLTLNGETGSLSGSCTTGGIYQVTFKASNTIGVATTRQVTFTAVQAPTRITTAPSASATVGKRYASGIVTTAYPAPTFTLNRGALPPGLVLNRTTGEITGTPTSAGTYSFAVNITSDYYSQVTSQYAIAVDSVPVVVDNFLGGGRVGDKYTDGVTANGTPSPTYSVTKGTLPDGLVLNAATGAITGTPTSSGDSSFTISAANSAGSVTIPLTMSIAAAPIVAPPAPKIGLDAGVGQPIAGSTVTVATSGLLPSSPFSVVLRSTPQVIAGGTADSSGSMSSDATIPGGLEPGWHSITLQATAADGSTIAQASWFQVTASGLLESTAATEPTPAEKAKALTNDQQFFQDQNINPATQAAPQVVQQTVQNVSTVVASVAIVSATAAVVASASAAVSASSAASVSAAASASSMSASAASSAATAGASTSATASAGATTGASASTSSTSSSASASTRTATAGGHSSSAAGSSGSSSSGSSGSSSSSGSSGSSSGGGDGGGNDGPKREGKTESKSGGTYENLDAENQEYAALGTAWGDALALWSIPLFTMFDRIGLRATLLAARFSPVLSRAINDGSYLRAMLGGATALLYLTAATIGFLAVDPTASEMATAASVPLFTAIVAIGVFDALAGMIGMTALIASSALAHPFTGLNEVRYIITIFILGFAPIILGTTFRKIRHLHERAAHLWERTVDVFMVALIAALTVLSLAGGISGFAGVDVPLQASVKSIAVVAIGAAVARVGLEELALRLFPTRVHLLNPTEVPEPSRLQELASLAFKYAVLVIMVGDMIGWGWWLWLGGAVLFVPTVLTMVMRHLPKSKFIAQLIPGGLGAFLLATLLSNWTGSLISGWFSTSPMYVALAFILIPIPVIITAVVGLFSDGSEKWYNQRNLTWVYIVGGVAVFAATVFATGFVGNITG